MALGTAAPHPGRRHTDGCSYLLQVRTQAERVRFLVQDLRTGERRAFGSEAELCRFIAERRCAGLR